MMHDDSTERAERAVAELLRALGYLPGEHIGGVSLPVRVVEHFARGVGVVVQAEHVCMSLRGIGIPVTTLRTSAFRGELAELPL